MVIVRQLPPAWLCISGQSESTSHVLVWGLINQYNIRKKNHVRRCKTSETFVPLLLRKSAFFILRVKMNICVFLGNPPPIRLWIDQLTGVSNKNIAAVDPRPAKRRNNLAIEDLAFCQRIWSNRRSCSLEENLIQRLIVTQVEGRLGCCGDDEFELD